MIKTNQKDLAKEAIILLREMFGEGIEFECIEHFKTNEVLTGIALKLPDCTTIPTVNLSDMPDNATAEDIANIAATTFQDALRDFKEFSGLPEMTRENVLANVVLQALSRKRNRQLLKAHPHIPFLDLAGVFRVPVGPYRRNSLSTTLISNQIFEKLELTIDELTEAARRNTVSKFGIQLINIQEMNQFFTKGRHKEPKPFGEVQMVSPALYTPTIVATPGLYTLTNDIEINGASLMLIPGVLEDIGEKSGMDYYILPSSIHELLIARDDGLVSAKILKEIVHEGNRTESVIKPEDVL